MVDGQPSFVKALSDDASKKNSGHDSVYIYVSLTGSGNWPLQCISRSLKNIRLS